MIEMNDYVNKKKQGKWLKSICATAAAFAIVVGALLGIVQYQTALAIESVVIIDVNPSLKLEVNKNEKLVYVEGINEEGNLILEGIEQDGKRLKSASGAISIPPP